MIRGVYLVLDPDQTAGRSAPEVAAAALRGGVRAVQWRQKVGSIAAWWPSILEVRDLCRQVSGGPIPFLINDRVDVALAVDADGAHVGQDDLPATAARQLLGGRIVGVSAGSMAEVRAAERAGADYLGVGPIFATASKMDAGSALGLDFLREVHSATELPLVAIGGITVENVASVQTAGADAVAVISAICGAPDVEMATRSLVEQVEGAVIR
jgi:thiamine-phosphate pyrophosphorylase